MDTLPHVVIIGGGFGGMRAARNLRDAAVRITLIDKSNHHLFQPLLYQVATAGLSAPSIAAPIRHILAQQRNLTVLLDDATQIDAAAKRVMMRHTGALDYDYLVVASGATHSYFGHDDWAPFAPGLKTLADAFEIRKRVLMAFEFAEREADPAKREHWLTFAVIGAGATGVEMAGTLAEIGRKTLGAEFRRIDPKSARVVLLEGADRVLPPYAPDLSEKARRQLHGLGVEVRTSCRVTGIDADGVTFNDGEVLRARTVIWAAGVAASPLGKTLGVPLDRAGRVLVEPDLSVAGHPELFVIGDLASISTGGQADGRLRGAKHSRQSGRHGASGVPLQRCRRARHHRAPCGGSRNQRRQAMGSAGLAVLAVRAHFFPDRLSRTGSRDIRLGLVLSHLRAACARGGLAGRRSQIVPIGTVRGRPINAPALLRAVPARRV